MKAYAVDAKTVIRPFNDPPSKCLILNRELSKIQDEALSSMGIGIERTDSPEEVSLGEEHVLFSDNLYFTEDMLKEFIDRSRKIGGSTVCALKRGLVTLRSITATQDVKITEDSVEYPLFYTPASGSRNAYRPVVIDPEEFVETIRLPTHMFGSEGYPVPSTTRFLSQISHWANLWAANLSALLGRIAALRKAPKSRLLLLALRARSANQWKVLRKTNQIGKNCDVHPSAYLEGCRVGDNVEVGAGAVIRLAEIGNNVSIGNNVAVYLSVLGDRCKIFDGANIEFSVLYPGSVIDARLIEASLLGIDSFVGDGASLTDFRFDRKTIQVVKDSVAIDTGNHVLGVCLGHRAYLGSGCIVAPGREIPNGLRIVPEKSKVITKASGDEEMEGCRRVSV
ncbi:MAG: hypothetical protein QW057_07990 [Candidatus Bathyarchaeia archaeon]